VEKITIKNLANKIQTEAEAYAYLESIRWPDKPVCPHCGVIGDHYFLTPENKVSRKTRTGAASQRRVWKCRDCRRQFSVITGTVMHGTRASIRDWLFVIFEMAANKNGIAAYEIHRKYGIANRTAWFMCHRVREAMIKTDPSKMLGVVQADETWIGGEPKNRHANKRIGSKQGKTDKTPVVSLIDASTGEVRSQVVADVTGKTLRRVIRENVELAQSTLHTDSAQVYKGIGAEMAGHESVDHNIGEYVRAGVSTNKAENYFSQLKRSIDGTHHNVSREHLHRYLAEFDFRYSTRKDTDTGRMHRLVGQMAGHRLVYKSVDLDVR
jgi:transposase-like protein